MNEQEETVEDVLTALRERNRRNNTPYGALVLYDDGSGFYTRNEKSKTVDAGVDADIEPGSVAYQLKTRTGRDTQ